MAASGRALAELIRVAVRSSISSASVPCPTDVKKRCAPGGGWGGIAGVAAASTIRRNALHGDWAGTAQGIQMAFEARSARSGSAGTGHPGPSVRAANRGVLRKEGEYWTVGYGGKIVPVHRHRGRVLLVQ